MARPEPWLVAGPNGAGKTTCAQKNPIAPLLAALPILNPDDRTFLKLRAAGHTGFAETPADVLAQLFIESADEVSTDLEAAISRGERVGAETVLSSDKYRPLVEAVLRRAGFVGLIYIALRSPAISRERVAARVRRGGHGVPEDKLPVRWHRSLNALAWFAEYASAFWVFDNSDPAPAHAPPLVASGKVGRLEYLAADAFPEMKAALAAVPGPFARPPDPT